MNNFTTNTYEMKREILNFSADECSSVLNTFSLTRDPRR